MNEELIEAVAALKHRIHLRPQIGITLGSGLGGLADEIQQSVRVGFKDIPNFPLSSVDGHRGELICGDLCGTSLLALSGRVHFYEGYSMQQVVFPVRVMAALGVKTVVFTNSVGAVNESYNPGDIVAIRDHINLMGDHPLTGLSDGVDLTEAYSSELRNLAQDIADKLDITLRSGVYLAYSGPSYETPAEIRAMRIMGADMVGMSTVPEVIMANSLGMKVLGLSVITNMAAGLGTTPLSHQDVIETSRKVSPKFNALVKGIIERLGRQTKQ
ncbi:MAG: purine-nucleoside phosphorylase [Desulfobacterales bacterium]|nr:MAG: purine-nucleoside phosphorylase [Desulfobacterales bacterium]